MLEWEEKEHERQQALAAAGGRQQGDAEDAAQDQQFVSYVALPDNKAIELRVLE